jgi:hypothetical protein
MRRAAFWVLVCAACGSSSAATDGGTGGDGTTTDDGTTGTDGNTGSDGSMMNPCGVVPDVLPEGDNGIAANHPNDMGIDSDACVIFSDGFETYSKPADLAPKWDNSFQNNLIRFATEPGNFYAGAKGLEFTIPQMQAELSDGIDKIIKPERDMMFLRYYAKFMGPYDVVGSSHNGSSISAHYFNGFMATPGVPANGTNKWLVNYEDWRGDVQTPSPGPLNVYVYWPEQRSNYGDHFFPNGDVLPNTSIKDDFGPKFVSRPNITPPLDTWNCYEVMVKANTPGQRDGRIAFWLDGKLLADFGNLRFRDIASLTIDHVGLSFHIGSNPNGEQKKWYDNVVAATSYIGPLKK